MKDPFIRKKFTKEQSHARQHAKEYFEKYPKERYQTEVESWREIQSPEYRVHHEAIERTAEIMPWSRAFEDPIELPDGRKMLTLTEAAAYITKVPKAVHEAPEWLLSGRT